MPVKSQADCYRTINGDRYICWCDVLEEWHEDEVAKCKKRKIPHRLVKVDNFKRLFVKETETSRLN